MADKGRGPVILLIFLLLIAVAAAFLGFIGLQNQKQINTNLTVEIDQLQVKKRAAEKQIADLNQQLDSLKEQMVQQQAKIQDFDNQVKSLNDELSAEKTSKEEALLEIAKIKEEAELLKTAKSNLESGLRVSEETLNNLKNEMTALRAAKEAQDEELKEAQAKSKDVQLDKIIVAPSPGTAQAPAVPGVSEAGMAGTVQGGKVLVVNKEYDFAVVNLGQRDNVAIADILEIYRNNKKIGELRVEEVRDAMSVAMPLTQGLIKQIKEDDKVVRK